MTDSEHTDAEVVDAFGICPDRLLQRWWYRRCKKLFAENRKNFIGLMDNDLDDLFEDSFILLWDKITAGTIFTDNGKVLVTKRNGRIQPITLSGYFVKVLYCKWHEMLRVGNRIVPFQAEEAMSYMRMEWTEIYSDEPDDESAHRLIMSQALLSMPNSCIEILTMFYIHGLTLHQILALRPESKTYNGLKTRKSKCVSNLKEKIDILLTKAGLK